MPESALIVSGCNSAARELWQILTIDGVAVQVHTPHTVLADYWPIDHPADVLLVDAELDLATTRELIRRMAGAGRRPAVVSFALADCAGLRAHLHEGHDYLIPPFHPYLVRRRIDAGRRQRDLVHELRALYVTADRREFERELDIGREIQRGFLPEVLPVVDGWESAARFEPAREVGGDFYDAYDLSDGRLFGFAIADVCDKGVGAALFMALIRSLLRQATVTEAPECHPGDPEPVAATSATVVSHAVRRTNSYLTTNHLHQAYFATLFLGVIDPGTGELTYINCGHNPPILRRADGEQTSLAPTGPALGLVHNARFGVGSGFLGHGDMLFLYTDGVPDARNADGEYFGEERLRSVLGEAGTPAEVVERFSRAVSAHAGSTQQFDDVTMFGLRRSGVGSDRPRPQRG